MNRIVTGALAATSFVAGWDAASFAADPDRFENAYRLVFAVAEPWAVAVSLGSASVSAGLLAVLRLLKRPTPDGAATIVLWAYASIVAVFGVSIFQLGWTAGTGAWKWLGWAAACIAFGFLALLAERRPGIEGQQIDDMLDAMEEAGMQIVFRPDDDDAA